MKARDLFRELPVFTEKEPGLHSEACKVVCSLFRPQNNFQICIQLEHSSSCVQRFKRAQIHRFKHLPILVSTSVLGMESLKVSRIDCLLFKRTTWVEKIAHIPARTGAIRSRNVCNGSSGQADSCKVHLIYALKGYFTH